MRPSQTKTEPAHRDESNLYSALNDLGFDTPEKKIAFIENLQITGCITDKKITEAVEIVGYLSQFGSSSQTYEVTSHPTLALTPVAFRLDSIKDKSFIEDTKKVGESIKSSFSKSITKNPDSEELCFSADLFLNSLAQDQNLNHLSKDDWQDLVHTLAQNAFGRAVGQERNEMKSANWAQDVDLKKQYFENARKLDMTEKSLPEFQGKKVDFVAINGASRPGMLSRFDCLLNYLKNDLKQEEAELLRDAKFVVLSGEREAWAEIDGFGKNAAEKTQEGKKYLLELSKKKGIELVEGEEFISYKNADEVPPGRIKDRTYLNYKDTSGPKIKEADIAKEMLEIEFNQELSATLEKKLATPNYKISFGISLSDELGATTRSNTIDTAKAFAPLVSGLDKEKQEAGSMNVNILSVAENPHGSRMATALARTLNESLPKGREVRINLLGNELNSESFNPQILHSSLASLVSEKLQTVNTKKTQGKIKRDPNQMSFQNRSKIHEKIEAQKTAEMLEAMKKSGLSSSR